MSPEEFIRNLSAHYSKRHESEDAKRVWMADIIAEVKGHAPKVLTKAAEIIRRTHEERAFPLPATIRRAIDEAAGVGAVHDSDLSPELQARFAGIRANRRRQPTPDEIAQEEQAQAWQADQIAKYGSWAAYHRAVHGGGGSISASKPDVDRVAFEEMQRTSMNPNLHMTKHGLSERSKAMSGDREDAA